MLVNMMNDGQVRLGTSGWNYPDWRGSFYPDGLKPEEYLEFYARHWPTVEVDCSFYDIPTAAMLKSWDRRTPAGFGFTLKVPRVITHERKLVDCSGVVAAFLNATDALGDKRWCAVLQFGYFPPTVFANVREFLERLGPFLASWPVERCPIAVEVRNAGWINGRLGKVLRDHQAGLVLSDHVGLPPPWVVANWFDPATGPVTLCRLLGDREGIEQITTTWEKRVLDRSPALDEVAKVLEGLADRTRVLVYAANHYEGHSPETLTRLAQRLGPRVAGPAPSDQPPRRLTLFE